MMRRNDGLKGVKIAVSPLVQKSTFLSFLSFNGERYTIAHAALEQSLMVNTSVLKRTTFSGNATGRVLLAYLDNAMLKKIVKKEGIPGDEWENIHSYTELKKALGEIKKTKIAFKLTEDGQVQFLGLIMKYVQQLVLVSLQCALKGNTGER